SALAEHAGDRRAEVGGALADVDAGFAHRRHLGVGRAGPAADDGAGVAHPASRRRRAAGDEADHRTVEVVTDPRRRRLLRVTADLSDQDYRLGLRVIA